MSKFTEETSSMDNERKREHAILSSREKVDEIDMKLCNLKENLDETFAAVERNLETLFGACSKHQVKLTPNEFLRLRRYIWSLDKDTGDEHLRREALEQLVELQERFDALGIDLNYPHYKDPAMRDFSGRLMILEAEVNDLLRERLGRTKREENRDDHD